MALTTPGGTFTAYADGTLTVDPPPNLPARLGPDDIIGLEGYLAGVDAARPAIVADVTAAETAAFADAHAAELSAAIATALAATEVVPAPAA